MRVLLREDDAPTKGIDVTDSILIDIHPYLLEELDVTSNITCYSGKGASYIAQQNTGITQ